MHVSWILSLPDGYSVKIGAGNIIEFENDYLPFSLRCKDESIRSVVPQLELPGISLRDFLSAVEAAGSTGGATESIYFLRQLARRGSLWLTAADDGRPLATLVPISSQFSLSGTAIPTEPFLLSRFAHTHRLYDLIAIESPLSHARVILHDERVFRLLHQLATPQKIEDLTQGSSGFTHDNIEPLLQLLSHAGMLTGVDERGIAAEDEDEHLKYWEFHDLLFHAASREGRHDGPVGGTFPWAGVSEPLPAIPATHTQAGIPLHRPDATETEQREPTFSEVVAARQSIREYGTQAIDAKQLGEFLYRVGRVTEQFHYEFDVPGGPVSMDFAARPYPSAGGVYELEIYPLVQNCSGIESGLYYYNAKDHRLELTGANDLQQRQLLHAAGDAAGVMPDDLQVALIIAARFGRMTWKYTGMAYAAILKDVGSLYQTMYLTATAMGLAPCGLGAGDSDMFASAIGSSYYGETSVGEFLLGSSKEVAIDEG